MYRLLKGTFDVHTFYLPEEVVHSVKTAAAGNKFELQTYIMFLTNEVLLPQRRRTSILHSEMLCKHCCLL